MTLWKVKVADYDAKPHNTVFETKEKALKTIKSILHRYPYTKVHLLKENKTKRGFKPHSTYTINTRTGKIKKL